MKDKVIVKFQIKLPKEIGIEDTYQLIDNSWVRTPGDYDNKYSRSQYRVKGGHLKCPICSKVSDFEITHGLAYRCGRCTSVARSYGNSLCVWERKIKELRREKLRKIEKDLKIIE